MGQAPSSKECNKNEDGFPFVKAGQFGKLFPDIKIHHSGLVGFRPSIQDSIPAIGQSPKNPYIYYCFGHQHVGWTLGGISGKLIAQEVSANKTDIDLKSFSPERF